MASAIQLLHLGLELGLESLLSKSLLAHLGSFRQRLFAFRAKWLAKSLDWVTALGTYSMALELALYALRAFNISSRSTPRTIRHFRVPFFKRRLTRLS
jgi:hypothetical protein